MYEEKMERICALLCLLSPIELREDDPPLLSRKKVHAMLRSGALDGLVLRKTDAITEETYQRARKLLGRALAVGARVEEYCLQGYRIVLMDDPIWPHHLSKLEDRQPLYLFIKGNPELLKGRKVSVAGKRAISKETFERTQRIGRLLAQQGMTVVSGGANGVDSAAVWAALDAGGNAIIIPAYKADVILSAAKHQKALQEGKLLLMCETPPDEVFSAGKALTRNHTIYAMGDVAMVIAAKKGSGGSWAGATACLKHAWSPLYVLDESGAEFEGNEALIDMGALRMQIVRDGAKDELLMQGMDAQLAQRLMEHLSFKELPYAPVRIPVTINAIERHETLRYLGWNGQEISKTVTAQIEKAEKLVLESICPAAVIGEFDLDKEGRFAGTNFVPKGEAISLLLDGCNRAVLLAATLGAQSERMLLKAQAVDAAFATVLDAVLSAAIETVCDCACGEIEKRAKLKAWETTPRFSPGYGDMPIEQTGEICEVLNAAAQIGLTVSSKGLMIPRKSVCAIVGEGADVKKNKRSGCAFCAHREGCKKKHFGKCACAAVEE